MAPFPVLRRTKETAFIVWLKQLSLSPRMLSSGDAQEWDVFYGPGLGGWVGEG